MLQPCSQTDTSCCTHNVLSIDDEIAARMRPGAPDIVGRMGRRPAGYDRVSMT